MQANSAPPDTNSWSVAEGDENSQGNAWLDTEDGEAKPAQENAKDIPNLGQDSPVNLDGEKSETNISPALETQKHDSETKEASGLTKDELSAAEV